MWEDVDQAIISAADTAILPRYQALLATDVHEKDPGDYVTIADHEAESLITSDLQRITPGVPVLGEEAAAEQPRLAKLLLSQPRLWVVDPLDGTRAFIDGQPDFAVMVALIEAGRTVAAWIWQPIPRVMFTATRGGGASRNGFPVRRDSAANVAVSDLTGITKLGFMPKDVRSTIAGNSDAFKSVSPGPISAGYCYPELVEGIADFVMFWRTLAWDHAPGVLIAEEAGCHVARLDGSPYDPTQIDLSSRGLLAASDPLTWEKVRDTLRDSSSG